MNISEVPSIPPQFQPKPSAANRGMIRAETELTQTSSVLGDWLARGRLLRLQNLLNDLCFVLAAILALYENAILFDCKLYRAVHCKKRGLGPSPLDMLLAHINVVSGCDGVGLIDLIHGCRRTVCVPVCC
jgi:hypothetical protein